jgi:hypothetical protein
MKRQPLGALLTEVQTRRNMANTKPSRSAKGVALLRAIETQKPEAEAFLTTGYSNRLHAVLGGNNKTLWPNFCSL